MNHPGGAVAAPGHDPEAVPLLRIEHVTRRFGPVTALRELSLDIHRGEIFALLGGSGSGKTTLLRMLAGFETPDAGRILLDGEDMAATPPHARPVNMMFQSYALFPHMDVARNIGFGLRMEGLGRAEIARRVEAVLDLVQLPGYGPRRPHQLSGGQRQRVALARSLVKRPKLLLLDEPLGALDASLREQTQFELVEIQRRTGITFVMVTHDQQEAMTMAHRIAVMADGALAQLGTPAEVYDTPASRFVASFLGGANLFDGVVASAGPQGTVIEIPATDDATPAVLHSDGDAGRRQGARVHVAVRPERMTVRPAGVEQAPGPNRLMGTVRDIAYRGDRFIIVVAVAGGAAVRVSAPSLSRPARLGLVPGDAVAVEWPSAASVVLAE